jgi:hypothetical protein
VTSKANAFLAVPAWLLQVLRCLLVAFAFLAASSLGHAAPCTLELQLATPKLPLNSGDSLVLSNSTHLSRVVSVSVQVDLTDMVPPDVSRITFDGLLSLVVGYAAPADVVLDPHQLAQIVTVRIQDANGSCGETRATVQIRTTSPVAIVVGVDKNKLSNSLHYARADAIAVVEHLVEGLQLEPRNIWLLTHDVDPESLKYKNINLRDIPSPDAITTAILEAAQRTAGNTKIYFYFSGHQYVRPPINSDDKASNYFFVLPNSTPNASATSSMYSWDSFADTIYQIKDRVIIAIIDSCYSGMLTAGYSNPDVASAPSSGTPKQLAALTGADLPRKKKLYADALLSASSGKLPSWEFVKLGHGVFTAFILKSDDYARQHSLDITLDELFYRLEIDDSGAKGIREMTMKYPAEPILHYVQIPDADIDSAAHDTLWAHYKK